MIQVFAHDDDGQEGPNGQVTYSIVSKHNKFTIDPRTGWLSTNAVRMDFFFNFYFILEPAWSSLTPQNP